MFSLNDRNVLVVGVAGKLSIAYHLVQAFVSEGANVYAVCQSGDNVEKIATLLPIGVRVIACDVTDHDQVARMVSELPDHLDVFVHSIAGGLPPEMLKGNVVATFDMDCFLDGVEVSGASLLQLTKALGSRLSQGSSIIALTYLGSRRVFSTYGPMGPIKAMLDASIMYIAGDLGPKGIRCNGVAPGPMKTYASRAIERSGEMVSYHAKTSSLRRVTTPDDMCGVVLFLASDYSSGVTGEIINVDCGYGILGAPQENI